MPLDVRYIYNPLDLFGDIPDGASLLNFNEVVTAIIRERYDTARFLTVCPCLQNELPMTRVDPVSAKDEIEAIVSEVAENPALWDAETIREDQAREVRAQADADHFGMLIATGQFGAPQTDLF